MSTRPVQLLKLTFLCVAWTVAATDAHAVDPATDYKQVCSSCHTIGGGARTGPDLKDVSKRKDRDWLVRFIVDPTAVLDSGDEYAAQLLTESRGARMPNISGMTKKRAELLLDLINTESQLEKSQFAGVQIPVRPFTKEDVELGRKYFTGEERLKNGGAACISCHHVGGLGGFGGGRLGPDLTKVSERLGGRAAFAPWLSAPATPTMLPTYRDHPMEMDEILPLVAFFEHAAKTQQEEPGASLFLVLLIAAIGCGALLALAGRLWNFRFRAVRRPLVESSAWKHASAPTAESGEGTSS